MAKLGGTFTAKIRMAVVKAKNAGASIVLNSDSHFGFYGGQRRMFLAGPLFKGVVLDHPTPDPVLTGQPFDVEITRAAAAGAADVTGLPAALVAPWLGAAGAAGAASRWVTLPDCLPTDRPAPRREASALRLVKVSSRAAVMVQNFMRTPRSPAAKASPSPFASTLDSNMQRHYTTCHVVKVHMTKSAFEHQGF